MVKGNANFMSPEQARGQPVDARSDLFSLALALYYCLSGELLYSGTNDLEVLYRAASGLGLEDIGRIRKLADPAPQILERAMALDPGDRFQSATRVRRRAGRAHGRRPRRPDAAHAGPVHRRPASEPLTRPDAPSAAGLSASSGGFGTL